MQEWCAVLVGHKEQKMQECGKAVFIAYRDWHLRQDIETGF